MAGDYSRVHRLLQLIAMLQSRRAPDTKTLAETCGTSERNIYRDLRVLRACGIADDRKGSDGYGVRPGFFMPPVELTLEESLSLLVMAEQCREKQIAFQEHAGRALEKIRSQLPSRMIDALEPLDARVTVDLARGSADDSARDVYERVRRAIASRRVLRCQYEAVQSTQGAAADKEVFELRPYQLWYCQRAWYVVGYHCGRREVRTLKLSRFVGCELTGKPYGIPDNFRLADHLGMAWRMRRGKRHKVAVRFMPEFAETVGDTRWHPSQQEESHEDGSVTLRFSVDGLDEIIWWILGYGPGAVVLEPRELVERVRDSAQATARLYAEPPPGLQ
jgi:proteasome accessory factor B